MANKVYRGLRNNKLPTTRMHPLWFVEGLAEYLSTDMDSQAEMVMRDAVVNNYLVGIKDIFRIYGSFLMYKEGQSFLEFAGEKYGKQRVLDILENIWTNSAFSRVLEYTFKKDLEELDAVLHYYLKQKYYPLLDNVLPL